MGSGSWDCGTFDAYTRTTKAMSSTDFYAAAGLRAQALYKSRHLSSVLDPKGVIRECRDSEEHPNTLPVILALDVTGSMGDAAVKVAQQLNTIMTDLYQDNDLSDVQFCIMGIGDLAFDKAPIQISQFESDIRIAEQLDELYFEGGGGWNNFESYTAAWYMGTRHTDLDCWKRGKKGIIITLGDELINPTLPASALEATTGDNLQASVETTNLYKEASEKFNIYHLSIDDEETGYHYRQERIDESWSNLLGSNYFVATLNSLAGTITRIIKQSSNSNIELSTVNADIKTNENNEVDW